jgi:hypothetical protein
MVCSDLLYEENFVMRLGGELGIYLISFKTLGLYSLSSHLLFCVSDCVAPYHCIGGNMDYCLFLGS